MYAIVEAGGKQYKAQEGSTLTVDLLSAEPGSEFVLDKVLMIGGEETKVGAPYIEGAKVTCQVAGHAKGPKLVVFHKWRRNDSHKKQGHRQGYTQLTVQSIQA